MSYILITITILSLLCSTFLLVKEFNTVERWQTKGLKIYHEKVVAFDAWKTNINPGKPEQWLTANPLFLAIKIWVELISNMTSLLIAVISGISFYWRTKKPQMEKV